ncbi:M12 family metallo-peptidase [Aliiglaciecola sp. 2_MG-2023]|uniref:reprolysin-like metallopeptidase n=1 Tax=unclassified Aliiglaciecola TaxID=2593648 RepID=UPI0026E36B8F|nr:MULTISPECIES: zinc-dependent metalloprotease family protein [unclassified Aliiglaciecola]MDO6709616.1 M12 family metallo-peptidase [Aliiglaciecola sp. 2_MG-2023]MDO6750842.1 M12 family metallo-peptidase [Aliiglaciecola sp. 1_MG-2023]
MTINIRIYIAFFFASICLLPLAQAQEFPLWQQSKTTTKIDARYRQTVATGNELTINPIEFTSLINNQTSEFELSVPTPEGDYLIFKLQQVRVMAEPLAEKFPLVRSFTGYNVNNPQDKGRFDLSPDGLSAMFKIDTQWAILTFDKLGNTLDYVSYWVKDEITPEQQKSQLAQQQDYLTLPATIKTVSKKATSLDPDAARANGNAITTYRIAISTSGEYTAANGGEAGTIAELAKLINRINQILLTDLAIQFELVANNDRIIYTDSSTDPFVNDASDDLEANQIVIDDLIGPDNYDIGHVLNTDSGGLATIQSICIEDFKARGQTGSNRPFGESFYTQLVIHEFGHQLGAEHTFNASNAAGCSEDQRSRNAAVEPGSGSTIMSYAGLCSSQNIQNDSDDYFHSFSVEQIQSLLSRRNCGSTETNGNAIPIISSSEINHSIPANTPFVLTAQATDSDNDLLTYSWDQVNPGGFDGATESVQEMSEDNGFNPLFRSYPPSDASSRYFPQISQVLNDSIGFGEAYPTTERALTFELLVRDGNGGVITQFANINVEPTDTPFSVTTPIADARWIGGQSHLVDWQVASTNSAPISCSAVDILLDADGDNVFESTLLANTANDGQQNVTSPSTSTSSARIKVRCSDNVFYAVNPGSFEIVPGSDPVAPLITGQIERTELEDTSFVISFADLLVDDPDSSYPSNFSLDVSPGANYVANETSVSPNPDFSGSLIVNISVNDGVSDSNVFPFTVQIEAVNDAPVAVNDSITIDQDSGTINIDVLSNDTDADQDSLIISEVTYVGSGRVSINNGQVSYTPANGYFGSDSIIYRIEDPSFATDSATISITVNQEVLTPTPLPTPDDSSGGGSFGWLLMLLAAARLRGRRCACCAK